MKILKFIPQRYYIAFGIYVSFLIFYLILSQKFWQQDCFDWDLDGADLLVGLLTIQLGFVAFVLPLLMDMIYRISDIFAPYHRLSIDYFYKALELKENLISSIFCLGFICIGVFFYTHSDTKSLNILYWRVFLEIPAIFWTVLNLYDSIQSILYVIRVTRKEVDENFINYLYEEILDIQEKNDIRRGKNRNDALRLILKCDNPQYDALEIFQHFIHWSSNKDGEKYYSGLLKVLDSLLYFWLKDFQSLYKSDLRLDEKLKSLFWCLDNAVKYDDLIPQSYKREKIDYDWKNYEKLASTIAVYYEEALHRNNEIFLRELRHFFIYLSYGDLHGIIDNLHKEKISYIPQALVYNYFKYEKPIYKQSFEQYPFYGRPQAQFESYDYSVMKFILHYYDLYVSIIISFWELGKYFKEQNRLDISMRYQKEAYNLLHYFSEKEKVFAKAFLQDTYIRRLYLPSFLRRYFLWNIPIMKSLNKDFNSSVLESRLDKDKSSFIPNRNNSCNNHHIYNRLFESELDLILSFRSNPFSFKDDKEMENYIFALIEEYCRENNNNFLYSLASKANNLQERCNDENVKKFLSKTSELSAKYQRNIYREKANLEDVQKLFVQQFYKNLEENILLFISYEETSDSTSHTLIDLILSQGNRNLKFYKEKILIKSIRFENQYICFAPDFGTRRDYGDVFIQHYENTAIYKMLVKLMGYSLKSLSLNDVVKYLEITQDKIIITNDFGLINARYTLKLPYDESFENLPIHPVIMKHKEFFPSAKDNIVIIIPKVLFAGITIGGDIEAQKPEFEVYLEDNPEDEDTKILNIKGFYEIHFNEEYFEQVEILTYDDKE